MKPIKIINNLISFLLPAVSVWLIIFYIRTINYFHLENKISVAVAVVSVVPVIFLEIFFTKVFKGYIGWLPNKKTDKFLLFGRIFFWFVLFIVWAVAMPLFEDDRLWLEFFHFSFVPMTFMIYIAGSFLTYIALVVWIIIYYFVTVRKKILRIATSLFTPLLFTWGLFYDFYFKGGIASFPDTDITQQPGIEIFYNKDNFPKDNYYDYIMWSKEMRFFPREIHLDKKNNVLFANYASTYGGSAGEKAPTLLRIDINTKQTKYFKCYYARTFCSSGDIILISPWFDNKIYELSKETLDIIKEIPIQTDIWPWEIINIYRDTKTGDVYVFNDMRPAIFKYDSKGKLVGQIIPEGLKYSGTLWEPQVLEKERKIYVCVFGGKDDIFEIDMDTLKILRKLDLVFYGGSCLLLDKENRLLYFQDGGTNKLFEIKIDDFNVVRVLKGEIHSRAMHLDKKRNCLYLLSYFYGRMSALDLKTGEKVWCILVGAKPYGLAVDNDTAYVNSVNGIVKIDLETVWGSSMVKSRKSPSYSPFAKE